MQYLVRKSSTTDKHHSEITLLDRFSKDNAAAVTTARADQSNSLTNGRAANWAPEVAFSFFPALYHRQQTSPFCC